ncbi:DUF87 domain-containing protein [Virgisporangium ochraceum]
MSSVVDLFIGENITAEHQRGGTRVALPTADFTTHGVIVGMTGSGKTGLGVVLVEEVLRSGVPCLLIDPKGDLTNLLLTFPDLAPADFRPWVNASDAQKAGQSLDDFAAAQAKTWTDGLAGWGLGGADISALRAATSFTIYTPGSTVGVPLNLVGSLRAPTGTADAELVHDEIEGFVTGLLALVDIDADPLSSREHILLSNLIDTAWQQGRDLDLPTLVGQVADPPVRKLGVFDLDTFFPPRDRMDLAVRLNGLLASSSFAAWSQGVPVDLDAILRPGGKPAAAIVTLAHLSDQERQFAVSLILSKLVTWMRRQSGTTDLRALVYLDEVAGYLPPTATPPTKKPIMLLMKQARAFGVGVVLATQNPVDIDYKALTNAGTWVVGRLQTERDKARLLDGMTAAAGTVDVAAVGDTISGLGKREFVLRRAGKDRPEVFTSRWAMSYLRGSLDPDQIRSLMSGREVAPPASAEPAAPAAPALGSDETSVVPEVAADTPVRWVDPAAPWLASVGGAAGGGTRYEAAAVARVRLRFDEEKADLVVDQEWEAVLFPLVAQPSASTAVAVDYDDRDLREAAPTGAAYALPAAPVKERRFWTAMRRDLADHLVRSRTVEIFANRDLKVYSRPGETRDDFLLRCTAAADAKADEQAATLRAKYEARAKTVRSRLQDAEDRAELARDRQRSSRLSEVAHVAGDVLGSFLGGRSRASALSKAAGSLGGIASRRGRSSAASDRLDAAENKVGQLQQDLADVEADLARELTAIQTAWDAKAAAVETVEVGLERTDVQVTQLVLAWLPVG